MAALEMRVVCVLPRFLMSGAELGPASELIVAVREAEMMVVVQGLPAMMRKSGHFWTDFFGCRFSTFWILSSRWNSVLQHHNQLKLIGMDIILSLHSAQHMATVRV